MKELISCLLINKMTVLLFIGIALATDVMGHFIVHIFRMKKRGLL